MKTLMDISTIHSEQDMISPVVEYKLLFVISGDLAVQGLKEYVIRNGNIVLLTPYGGSELKFHIGCDVMVATLDAEFMESMIGIPQHNVTIFPGSVGQDIAERLIDIFDIRYNKKDGSKVQDLAACVELLHTIESALPSVQTVLPPENEDRVSQMARYIQQNFRQSLQLSDLSEKFGVSRQHISTTLHRELGIPFMEYLQKLRLGESMRLLLTTDYSISKVAEDSGFPNLKAFNQAFQRRYQQSPRNFRRRNRPAAHVSEPSAQLLQQVNQLLGPYRMIYQKSDSNIHLRSIVKRATQNPYPDRWRDILNIDSSAMCTQAVIQEEIREIQTSMGFRYARLGNLLCEELFPYIHSQHRHRYTFFLQVVDFLKSVGLIPMLAFGDSYSVSQDYVRVNIGSYSVSQQDWLEFLDRLLDISIDHWGDKWVSTWRFELHMPIQLYNSESPSAFIQLFNQSQSLIHKKLPNAMVGGPSMSLDHEHMSRWNAWFHAIQKGNLNPDFISMELWAEQNAVWIPYSGQFGEPLRARKLESIQNADAELMLQQVRQMHKKMDESGIAGLPLYISALGITKYHALPAQIGGHCGAYLVKCVLALQEQVDGIGCWKAFNQEAEYVDEYQVLGMGCGVLSRYGLRNPSWYAYSFFAQLLPYFCYQDQTVIVTSDGSGSYTALIQNCKNYSEYFCRYYRDSATLNFSDSRLYVNNTALQQTLEFPEALASSYQVKQYLVGNHHGCLAVDCIMKLNT